MTTPGAPGAPLGMSDFFGLEAGEYLERLDGLLTKPEPAVEEFVKHARALRGSALMAKQTPIARAATALETLARAVRDGRRGWDGATRQLAVRAVDDLKILVRRVAGWSDGDTAKADALAAELERSAGRPSGAARAAEPQGLDAGARAFVAREGAAIANALDRAAQSLVATPPPRDPLQPVLRALQPLRGLAALADLPPLPDLLEGIERAAAGLVHPGAKPGDLVDLCRAGAAAIARAAREVADRGRPDPEAPEFQRFASLAVAAMEWDADAVPIASLYHEDAGPHIVKRGTAAPPAPPAATATPALGRLELVSHGEHLRQAADSLERAPSATQRELRAHTLAGTFRALATVSGSALAERVAQFAAVARDLVTNGTAGRAPGEFAGLLRQAGDVLARSGDGDDAALVTAFDELVASARGLAPAPPPPSPSLPVETVPESQDLIGSWAVYQRLSAAGIGRASLDELLHAPSLDTARPAARAAPTAPAPPRPPAAEPSVVDIRTLVYRGDRALERAQELRSQAQHATGEALRALIDEVCDLVALALDASPPPARRP